MINWKVIQNTRIISQTNNKNKIQLFIINKPIENRLDVVNFEKISSYSAKIDGLKLIML